MTPVNDFHDAVRFGTQNLTSNDISSYMYVKRIKKEKKRRCEGLTRVGENKNKK